MENMGDEDDFTKYTTFDSCDNKENTESFQTGSCATGDFFRMLLGTFKYESTDQARH